MATSPTRCDDWPTPQWPCDVAGVDPDDQTIAARLAATLLEQLAGGRVGICNWVEGFWPDAGGGACGLPYKDATTGAWHNGGRGGVCCQILLGHAPVRSITEVTENGVVLDPAAYALEGTWLRRRGSCWPAVDDCDDPTVVVAYRAGAGFPNGAELALGEVACEFLDAIAGRPCKLPSRAVQITRQGVTVDLAAGETVDFLGLPIADAWLRSINPTRLHSRSRVLSPDLPRRAPMPR